ncbi:MAG: zinc ribbon domain-containing protein [Cyanobacteria bacterium P01_A01_bin.84]
METLTCPRCQKSVDKQAIACPYCRTQLKAYGHPGIPLYHAAKDEYLCDRCTYHFDESCTFPKRPYAKNCTLYEDITDRQSEIQQQQQANSANTKVQQWIKRNQSLLLLLGLLLFCIVLVLFRS